MSLEKIKALKEIAPFYSTFLVDLWGVVHNGVAPFPDVLPCLSQLKTQRKNVVFLTNGPRRSHAVQKRLEEMGISSQYYDFIFSSGEDAFYSFTQEKKYTSLGANGFYLGPAKDYSLFQDLQIKEVLSLEEADFIVCTGPSKSDQDLSFDKSLLKKGLDKNIPVICINPDRVVHFGTTSLFCAGELAHWYEKNGGLVFYHGKPYTTIYENALRQLSYPDKEKILVIGDSLSTDIKGAYNMGIDSLLIASGIQKDDFFFNNILLEEEKLKDFFASQSYCPRYITEKLSW